MRFLPATASAVLSCLALAACVSAPKPAPAPVPAPAPTPTPTPTPTLPPFVGNWMDAPLTPGDWTYETGVARFGLGWGRTRAPDLQLQCDRATGAIGIARSGSAPVPTQMRILTETQERTLPITVFGGDPAVLLTSIAANDSLLDAMAFSKGRFAVEVPGLPTLYIPSYPEVTRVIEDCR